MPPRDSAQAGHPGDVQDVLVDEPADPGGMEIGAAGEDLERAGRERGQRLVQAGGLQEERLGQKRSSIQLVRRKPRAAGNLHAAAMKCTLHNSGARVRLRGTPLYGVVQSTISYAVEPTWPAAENNQRDP